MSGICNPNHEDIVSKGIDELNRMSASNSFDSDKNGAVGIRMTSLGEGSSLKLPGLSDECLDAAAPADSSYVLLIQVVFPFVIAGVGMVLAGMVLDIVQSWELFRQVPETFILVPALLGLKGNLEMTFASRLSTLANLGHLDSPKQRWEVISCNLCLIQVQATVVAFLASAFAVALAWIPRGELDWQHALLLCASSLSAACSASLILSLVMSVVVLASRRYNLNPDNIATPIAASLGDLTTLGVLTWFGSVFLRAHLTESWLNGAVVVVFLAAAPLWASIANRDETTRQVLHSGWSPVIFSMLISSSGGLVLEQAIRRFPNMAAFQPVINGVGGNLAAVQASRLSTYFHQSSVPGSLPAGWSTEWLSPARVFFSKEWDSRSCRVLLLLVVPGHILFNWMIRAVHTGRGEMGESATFTSLYLLAAIIQVLLLLYVCELLVARLWQSGVDPDNAAIPYLTAMGDVTGTLLLFLVFLATHAMHNEGSSVRAEVTMH